MIDRRRFIQATVSACVCAGFGTKARASSALPNPPSSSNRIVACTSDPQYGRVLIDPNCNYPRLECNRSSERVAAEGSADLEVSLRRIRGQYNAIRSLVFDNGRKIDDVIIGGDITEHGHGYEREGMAAAQAYLMYGNSYRPGSGDPPSVPVHFMLGNHDIVEARDCASNGCMIDSVEDMHRAMHFYENQGNMYSGDIDDWNDMKSGIYTTHLNRSMAYRFAIDKTIFYMLQIYPSFTDNLFRYRASSAKRFEINILSSGDWFLEDVKKLKGSGYSVVICIHDTSDKYPIEYHPSFVKKCQDAGVSAILTGHLHNFVGRLTSNCALPVLYMGSAINQLLLLTQLDSVNKKLHYLPCSTDENGFISAVPKDDYVVGQPGLITISVSGQWDSIPLNPI